MQKTTSFRSVFVRNEFKAIKGRHNSTIVYLAVILFITFLAFGFTQSTLNYQQKLSADPFSNWINLNFHSGTRDSLKSLSLKIADDTFRDRFHITGAYFYNKGMITVRTFSGERYSAQYEARTIDPGSGVVNDLLNSNACVKYFPDSVGNAFKYEPNGIIISEKLSRDIGLNPRTMSFVQIKSPMGDYVPVPLLAVVKELPDLADAVYTNLFYCKTMNSDFYDRENSYYRIFIEDMDTSGILRVLDDLNAALEIQDPSTVQTTRLKTADAAALNWKIEVGVQRREIPVSVKNERVAKLETLKNHHSGQYFELSKDTACDNSSFFHDYLAIEFHDLEEIRAFSKYLDDKLALQLNLEVLSEKENYLFTGNIAIGAIILLMVVSVVSVSIYVSGIIRNHLIRIKKNLGNFLAFGVKNSTLIRLYIYVAVKILVAALVPAWILACVFGELFENHLLAKLLVIDKAEDYFSLGNTWCALFIAIIMIVAVFRTYISIRRILTNTPGDLVYERDC